MFLRLLKCEIRGRIRGIIYINIVDEGVRMYEILKR